MRPFCADAENGRAVGGASFQKLGGSSPARPNAKSVAFLKTLTGDQPRIAPPASPSRE
jgi:hypothetical protein